MKKQSQKQDRNTGCCGADVDNSDQAQAPQVAGGGGAPGTGVDVSVPAAPGEGVTEKDIAESGLDEQHERPQPPPRRRIY